MTEYTAKDLKLLKATAKKLTDLARAAELAPSMTSELCALMHKELDAVSHELDMEMLMRSAANFVAERDKKALKANQ